ncbi:MAG: SGNH/GDSL hydrolase family protein [Flavobacteriales bacterium]|nr:SGNH/GDSL hydrolase family protein [Flavobacteriales bacterium]
MKNAFRSRLVRLATVLVVLVIAGELIARLIGAEPAYVRSGRIRRACGCRELRIQHAPPGMDSSVRYCINRLGLRGKVLPDELHTRIITLGNSTTECAYIDDAAAWPHLLDCELIVEGFDVWVGNAGVNGTSTRGNAIFLEDHLLDLRPDIVLFMPGAADRGRISMKQEAGLLVPEHLSLPQWFMENSRLIGSTVRLIQAREPRTIDWSTFAGQPTSPDTARMRGGRVPLTEHEVYVAGYAERLAHIADLCASRKVRLLLMTQPILAEDSSDTRRIMERYNTATKALAQARGLPLFDLASALRQDPAYYLDGIHFSNSGAAEVARLVTPFVREGLRRAGH